MKLSDQDLKKLKRNKDEEKYQVMIVPLGINKTLDMSVLNFLRPHSGCQCYDIHLLIHPQPHTCCVQFQRRVSYLREQHHSAVQVTNTGVILGTILLTALPLIPQMLLILPSTQRLNPYPLLLFLFKPLTTVLAKREYSPNWSSNTYIHSPTFSSLIM